MKLDNKGGKTWNKECINGVPTVWGGLGLDKDIVNMNENYNYYIHYNPKLVRPMDDLAVEDTGTTRYYITHDSPCNNRQQAVHPLPIQIPKGEIITSTHTALLSHPDLPLQAWREHLVPGLNKALLSIGTLCDHCYESTFNDKYVRIKNKQSGNNIMRGTRVTRFWVAQEYRHLIKGPERKIW